VEPYSTLMLSATWELRIQYFLQPNYVKATVPVLHIFKRSSYGAVAYTGFYHRGVQQGPKGRAVRPKSGDGIFG